MAINFMNKKNFSHWTGGWVGLRASTDKKAKRRVPIPTEDQILVIQPTDRCTTEQVIPPHK
jgi:hypothetical protein